MLPLFVLKQKLTRISTLNVIVLNCDEEFLIRNVLALHVLFFLKDYCTNNSVFKTTLQNKV